MKLLLITIMLFVTSACGQAFRAENHYSKSASSQGLMDEVDQPSPQAPAAAILDAAKATVLLENLTPVLLKMFKAFQDVTKVDYSKASQTLSSSQSVACPQGGSLTATATGTLNLSVNLLSASGTVSNGMGSVTFSNCAIVSGVAINGTVSILALNATLVASLNASAASTYSVTGNHNLVGNVSVSYLGQTQNCSLTLANELSSNGMFSLANGSASGTVSAHVSGSVCGYAVNVSKTESF